MERMFFFTFVESGTLTGIFEPIGTILPSERSSRLLIKETSCDCCEFFICFWKDNWFAVELCPRTGATSCIGDSGCTGGSRDSDDVMSSKGNRGSSDGRFELLLLDEMS